MNLSKLLNLSALLKLPVISDVCRGLTAVLRSCLPVLTYLYLVRVLVIALLVMLLMPLLSWLGPLRSLTVGAFDLGVDQDLLTIEGASLLGITMTVPVYSFVTVFLKAFMASFVFQIATVSLMTVADTFAYGFMLRYPGRYMGAVAKRLLRPWMWLCVAVVVINMVWMVAASGSQSWWPAISGAVAAVVLLCVVAPWATPLMGTRKYLNSNLKDFLGIVSAFEALHNRGISMKGYLKRPNPGSPPVLATRQGRTYLGATLVTLLYVFLLTLGRDFQEWMPPVATVYFLVMVAAFALSGVTYFFDRFRLPVLMVVVAFFGVMTLWRESDHYYAVQPSAPIAEIAMEKVKVSNPVAITAEVPGATMVTQLPPLGLPACVLGAHGMKSDKPVIVITLAGGGIQAAAWPLEALSALEKVSAGFHQQVALISGVSGGSVGAMYYAAAYGEAGEVQAFDRAAKAAAASSLGEVLNAALSDDFLKMVAPFLSTLPYGRNVLLDRGLALEQSFRSTGKDYQLGSLPEATLATWAEDALKGKRPAVIMNSTVVENGSRMAFSTAPCGQPTAGTLEFADLYRANVGIATAARLSATFPVVSPAARPVVTASPLSIDGDLPQAMLMPGPQYGSCFPEGGSYLHLVDGGYFENSGVAGAIAWLNEACDQLKNVDKYRDPKTGEPASKHYKLPKNLVIMQMSGFPQQGPVKDRAVDAGQNTRGTLFDVTSPLQTIIGIRGSLQLAFATDVAELFKKRWNETALMQVTSLRVQPVISAEAWEQSPMDHIGFLPQNPPLSWHLRQCEKEGIRKQVKESIAGSGPYEELPITGDPRGTSLKLALKRIKELHTATPNP